MHTTFILQEAILSIQEKKKAFVAFLDVRKGFNTMWHDGLLYKLCQFGFPKFILHSIYRRRTKIARLSGGGGGGGRLSARVSLSTVVLSI